MGYNNAYVGTLTYSGSAFSGSVNIDSYDGVQPLHFYFLGGLGFQPDPESISGNTASVVISDQSSKYPVISYAPSKQAFTGAGAYSAKLQNKVSIMKFNVITTSTEAIYITGMNNKVTVNFTVPSGTDNGFTYSMDGEGLIEMPAKNANNETWAIVLPQAALPTGDEGTAYTYDGYKGNRPALKAIASNQYITTDVDALNVSTFDINYMAFTFVARTDNVNIQFNQAGLLQYKIDDGEWTDLPASTNITVNEGQKMTLKGAQDNTSLSSGTFTCSGNCYIYGNVMSLLQPNDFGTATAFSANSAFAQLFMNNTHIDIYPDKELVLPATTLFHSCYQRMFYGCTGLTSAPALPAETLAQQCYGNMFYGCTSLTEAPALPATTLDYTCYGSMFYGCTSLTAAPALPATTLTDYCYGSMFRECTSLTEAPALPATTLTESCYGNMFYGCTSLTEAPALPATTLANSCYSSMFRGCTSLSTAPALPATTLANSCYSSMFYSCTSLSTAPALPATTLANSCYSSMFYKCTSLTEAPTLPATTLAIGCYNQMFRHCSSLSSVTCLATNINASDCTTYWLRSVANTGTFTTPKTTDWKSGYNGIPNGWTRVDAQ